MAEDIVVLKQFEDDDIYKQFLTKDFDVKTVTSNAVQEVSITENLNKLSLGIALLDKELHDQVAYHYEDLLSQANGIETLEGVLEMVHGRIQTLLIATERLRSKLIEPYNKVATQTTMLIRLQMTCDLLRRIIRILHLSNRLQTQLQGGVREITKAAQSLNELSYLMENVDLSGLEVIEKDQKLIKDARVQVEKQAKLLLEKGMETQNQAQVATALQVFHNLQILQPSVNEAVNQILTRLRDNIKMALDIKLLSQQPGNMPIKNAPGRAAIPTIGNSASFRATLWTNMENLMDQMFTACSHIQHLQKVLIKKRDPVTHVCFLDELKKNQDNDIVQSFWVSMTEILTKQFSDAAKDSTFIKQAFEGEYPKLLRLHNDLWKRLQQLNTLSLSSMELASTSQDPYDEQSSNLINFRPDQALHETLIPFENAYLSRSLSRLFDSVNVVFSVGSQDAPTKDDVENIIKTIFSELNAANINSTLSQIIAKNVAKTVQLFTVKCEQLITTDGDAIQVISPPTPSQILNTTIVNILYLFHKELSEMLNRYTMFPAETVKIIENSSESIKTYMRNAVKPILTSVNNSIEAIISTMHKEDFSSSVAGGQSGEACSLYMKELQSFISRAQNDYFSEFPDCDVIQEGIQQIACQTIEYFVLHASLIRPLGDGGKMRLAADFAQMEMAVSPLCRKIGDLGKHYKMLRSFRPLLFQTPSHISQSPVLGEIIPYSIALQFLFSRTPDLPQPYEVAGWSFENYCKWLDEHTSEKERLALLRGTLEAYVQSVRQRQGKEFCQMYPILLKILQQALHSEN